MNGFLLFLILLIFLLLPSAFAAYTLYTRRRARTLGLPPPSLNPFTRSTNSHTQNYPAPSGLLSTLRGKVSGLTKSGGGRTAGGAYEEPLDSFSGRGRGRGLDPDEAWDARVGAEADGYGGGAFGVHDEDEAVMPEYGSEAMGHGTMQDTAYIGGGKRGLDQRYDEAMGREDPFGDEAEVGSLHKGKGKGGVDESPTERRSMFHENV